MSVDLEEQYDKIYRYCYFKVRKQDLAEDITQETFLRFIRKYGYCEGEWVLRYLYRIAHNLCVDEYKKQMVEELPEEQAEGSFENKVLNQVVMQDALSKLSVEEKEIVAKANRALEFINYMQDVEFKRKEERQKYLEELQEFEDTIGGHHKVL